MKKKVFLFVGFLCLTFFVGACGQQETKQETITTEESRPIMRSIETDTKKSTKVNTKTVESTDQKEKTEEKQSTEQTKEKEVNTVLLQKYGEAYANFRDLNHRNEKLKGLMTEECIKMNGIDVKTGNALGSEGKVTAIYQNDQEEYAVLLDCIQNGSPIRILLLAKVEDGKIAEMTYNTLKQEY
ncbi:hypothetical protein BH747_02010 [Enterococcus villorum]|uniref:Lipoprotein n=1 Tax=Enterococcus villorum TaxID=112904 RepID=A0A1V8YU87_9ENTE|nr:EF0163 family protein [Enterococcus villorum]OQO71628.1 hypothetical protein BH747_02010 [Enterococcus villorum]OQO76192.1 hypothetical protein BH744_04415 [Enterococcus villorum]